MAFIDSSSFLLRLSTLTGSRSTTFTTSATTSYTSSPTTSDSSLDLGGLTSDLLSFTQTSSTPSATSVTSHSAGGLSVDAKIGVGIGVSAGGIMAIVAASAFIMYRRRKRSTPSPGESRSSSSQGSSPKDAPAVTAEDPENGTAISGNAPSPTESVSRPPPAYIEVPLPVNVAEADGGIIPELADAVPAAAELPAHILHSNTELDAAGAPIGARDRAEVPNAETRYELPA